MEKAQWQGQAVEADETAYGVMLYGTTSPGGDGRLRWAGEPALKAAAAPARPA
jgi:hypothetical protein